MSPDPTRSKDLAKIHLAKKQLGLDDEAYRDILVGATGQASAAGLDPDQRQRVLQALERLGFKASRKPFPGRPTLVPLAKDALIRKVEALLAEAQRPWAYAHGLARRMFKVDQVQNCDPDQLRHLVAALSYDARRHGRALS